jgi:hypothetical protein
MDIEPLIDGVLRVLILFYVLLIVTGVSIAALVLGGTGYLLSLLF